MDCLSGDCAFDPVPVIAPWAVLVAYVAALVIVLALHDRARRQPGAALRTYIAAVRPQLLPPTKPRHRRVAITVAVTIGVLLLIAELLARAQARTGTGDQVPPLHAFGTALTGSPVAFTPTHEEKT